MRIVGPIQILRGCVIYINIYIYFILFYFFSSICCISLYSFSCYENIRFFILICKQSPFSLNAHPYNPISKSEYITKASNHHPAQNRSCSWCRCSGENGVSGLNILHQICFTALFPIAPNIPPFLNTEP